MGAQQHGVADKKGILHIAGRMILGEIECFEVVKIMLDLRTFGNLKTKAGKNAEISSVTRVMGCLVPKGQATPGSVTSTRSRQTRAFRPCSYSRDLQRKSFVFLLPTHPLIRLTIWPTTGRSSAERHA